METEIKNNITEVEEAAEKPAENPAGEGTAAASNAPAEPVETMAD